MLPLDVKSMYLQKTPGIFRLSIFIHLELAVIYFCLLPHMITTRTIIIIIILNGSSAKWVECSPMVLHISLLNTQQYKARIKCKVEQSRERSSALPYTSV